MDSTPAMAPTSLMPTRAVADAPVVRLELRHGNARPVIHEVTGEEFLIGSVPGCDLRIPGSNLPPIICQIVRRTDGLRVRKLAPTQPIFLNGQPVVTQAALAHGDCIQIGAIELHVHLALPDPHPLPRPTLPPLPATAPAVSFVPLPAQPAYAQPMPSAQPDPWQQYRAEVEKFRDQVARFEERRRLLDADEQRHRDALEARQRHLEEQTRELESDRVLWYRRRDEIERECKSHNDRAAALTQQLEERDRELAQKAAETQRQAELL